MQEICPICGSCDIVIQNAVDKRFKCRSCDSVFVLKESTPAPAPLAPATKSALSPKEIYNRNINSILETTCNFGDIDSSGTAFCVSKKGFFVTNAHVLIGDVQGKKTLADSVYVCKSRSTDFISAEIVYMDAQNDLALLKVNELTAFSPLSFSLKPAEVGDEIVVIGNSKGEGLVLLNGIVGDVARTYGRTHAFVFNALVTHGCSGAPVLNGAGEVCGVTVGGTNDAAGMNYAISLDALQSFLSSARAAKSVEL